VSADVPAKAPGRGWYAVAAALVTIAVVVAGAFIVVLVRAAAGYTVVPFPADQPTTIELGERDVALWVSPTDAEARCTATDRVTGADSFSPGSGSMSFSTNGRTWQRVGIVQGAPGSTHTVVCGNAMVSQFGEAPNPRVGRYVVMGAVAGGLAALLVLAAFIIALVVAIRRSRARPAR
jgi:hypothetical protein